MVAEQGIKSINLYDIYANIIPGMIFIVGCVLTFEWQPLYTELLGPDSDVAFGIPHFLLLVTLSFVVGQLLQVAGSRFDGDHGFDRLMWKIRGADVSSRYNVSEFESRFWDMCRCRFELTGEFRDHGRLFKTLLAFLETKGRTRALRIQALYLFLRGLYISTLVLFLLYAIVLLLVVYGYLPERWTAIVQSPQTLVALGSGSYALSVIANSQRREFETDWIQYTVTECYLTMIDERDQ